MLIYGIYNTVNAYWMGESAFPLFDCIITLIYLLAAFSSVYINSGYQDGTLRGRVVVGRSRVSVYLANLAVLYLLGIFYMVLYALPVLVLGHWLLGPLPDPGRTAATALCCLAVLLAWASVFTLLAMLISGRGVGLISIFFAALMFSGSMYLDGLLAEPERLSSSLQLAEGHFFAEELEELEEQEERGKTQTILNPAYVKGPARGLLGLILEMNPGGQTVELLENTCRISPLWVLAVNAGSVALLSTMAGLLLFQKKDIK